MNELYRDNSLLFRVVAERKGKLLIINCNEQKMPFWKDRSYISSLKPASEEEILKPFLSYEDLSPDKQVKVNERYVIVAGILAFLADDTLRNKAIASIATLHNISKQTVRSYLITFLVYQDKAALAPKDYKAGKELTADERNFRYALNKYFYTVNKNSLNFTYVQMLKDRYIDSKGALLEKYPTFNQFRYFYRKTRKLETFFISRDGIKDYQKNKRPLLGENVQTYAEYSGLMGMVDSTVCDIYLVNDRGEVVGRPILTACVDTYSSLCMGYSLGWEGGIYSVVGLLKNMLTDKKDYCRDFGILISETEWNCKGLPLTFITDKGSEYKGENFEQITDLGITIDNLPAYRPDLKGPIEKFFDVVQGYFKPFLKGRGIVEPNFQERGARDYRKDAAFTLKEFETILLRCILFYNGSRVLEDFPYTEEMLDMEVRPYSNEIWNYQMRRYCPLVITDSDTLAKIMLPRTIANFTREGLKVNSLRYSNQDFKEQFLRGGEVEVSYNPYDVSTIYLTEGMIPFELIETRFIGKTVDTVEKIKQRQKALVQREERNSLQAQIDLAEHILTIRNQTIRKNADIKNIRENRKREIKLIKAQGE
ncbi:MAG: hypothetical protein E7273_10725 [Pseudobutyrivibrio ruminis]|nr:hypothetical protein [Pseudobutyrivibrio ruminis]